MKPLDLQNLARRSHRALLREDERTIRAHA